MNKWGKEYGIGELLAFLVLVGVFVLALIGDPLTKNQILGAFGALALAMLLP